MNKKDWKQTVDQWTGRLGKFKFPLLILLLGLGLVAIPTGPKTTEKKQDPLPVAQALPGDGLEETEDKLEQMLSCIEGAGRVQVMLQYASGEKIIYQMDNSQEVTNEEERTQTKTENKTVLATGTSAPDAPVAVQTLRPTYRGALVISDGAGSASVRLDLVNAVSGLTGLGADKITVVKMKHE